MTTEIVAITAFINPLPFETRLLSTQNDGSSRRLPQKRQPSHLRKSFESLAVLIHDTMSNFHCMVMSGHRPHQFQAAVSQFSIKNVAMLPIEIRNFLFWKDDKIIVFALSDFFSWRVTPKIGLAIISYYVQASSKTTI